MCDFFLKVFTYSSIGNRKYPVINKNVQNLYGENYKREDNGR